MRNTHMYLRCTPHTKTTMLTSYHAVTHFFHSLRALLTEIMQLEVEMADKDSGETKGESEVGTPMKRTR